MHAVAPLDDATEACESTSRRAAAPAAAGDSDADEALVAPLACTAPGAPPAARRRGWRAGLLATGLAGAALLLRARGALPGAGAAHRRRSGPAVVCSSALYVNLSALDLGEPGKPSEYLLLRGPVDNPNRVAVQVKQGECALDIVQSVNYLGRAGLQITQAVKTCKPIYNSVGSENYPDNAYIRTACAADASGIISSFSFVATFLSLAASHCSQTLNLPAICASSATGLVAALAKVSVEAATMAANCEGGTVYKPGPLPAAAGSDAVWQNDRRLTQTVEQQMSQASQTLEDTWQALTALNESLGESLNLTDPAYEKQLRMERDGELATCVIDATQASTYLAQMGVAIQKAAKGCPLQESLEKVPGADVLNTNMCAESVLEIISSLFNAGAFVAGAISHCALGINTQALCAQGAVGVVAATTELVKFLISMESACTEFPPILDALKKGSRAR
ncbi:unnamed protein product [Prorocentrum cordatum]|uniref:Uncharacterized protein n=1 Tax=Prorocentrum cordatum TaxID=2364126 RepID=A0ABN9Y6D6_9DINO|nr:unnamed protein product [Polarella glacialis]